MKNTKIFLCGVGGQGIGLLNEILIRSAKRAGLTCIGADTHGLAQRGGIVVSHLKIGNDNYSSLIPRGDADIVISLEIHEAMRASNEYLKDGGKLIYYSTSWQPLELRESGKGRMTDSIIEEECRKRNIEVHRVFYDDLKDRKSQNLCIVADIAKENLIPGISYNNYLDTIKNVIRPDLLEDAVTLFKKN